MAHITERVPTSASVDSAKEKLPKDAATEDVEVARGSEEKQSLELYPKLRPYILTTLALLILGWWISATVLKATRHRWYAFVCSTPRVQVTYEIETGSYKPYSLGLLFCKHVCFNPVFTCTFICLA